MYLLLLISKYSRVLSSKDSIFIPKPRLEGGSNVFVDFDSIDNYFDVGDRINTIHTIDSKTVSGGRNLYSYWKSYIEVKTSTFENCFSFGSGLTFGSGGALYLQQSALRIVSCGFKENRANFGGSVSVVNSRLIVSGNTVFDSETAYKVAGSIYALISDEYSEVDSDGEEFAKENLISVVDSTFKNCRSKGTHGAAFIYGSGDCYFQNVNCIKNSARHAGGALSFSNSAVALIECNFIQNSCGEMPTEADYLSIFQRKRINKELLIPRGGGSIIFQSNLPEIGYLLTQKCCFYKNIAHCPADEMNPGHDLVLIGKVFWSSIINNFGYQKAYSVGYFGSHAEISSSSHDTTYNQIKNCVITAENPIYILSSPLDIGSSINQAFVPTVYDTNTLHPQDPQSHSFPDLITSSHQVIDLPTLISKISVIPFPTQSTYIEETTEDSTLEETTPEETTPEETTPEETTPEETTPEETTPEETTSEETTPEETTPEETTPEETTPEETTPKETTPDVTPETPGSTISTSPEPTTIISITTILMETTSFIEQQDEKDVEKDNIYFLMWFLIGAGALIIINAFLLIVYCKNRKKSQSDDSLEMETEDINLDIIEVSDDAVNSVNSLLWMTVVTMDDDPFAVDFEEGNAISPILFENLT